MQEAGTGRKVARRLPLPGPAVPPGGAEPGCGCDGAGRRESALLPPTCLLLVLLLEAFLTLTFVFIFTSSVFISSCLQSPKTTVVYSCSGNMGSLCPAKLTVEPCIGWMAT